jgi:hypothetical protein
VSGFGPQRQIREAISREDAALLRWVVQAAIKDGSIFGVTTSDRADFLLQKLRRLEK